MEHISKLVKTLALPGLPGGPGGPLSPGGPLTPVPMQLKHVSPRSPKKICIEKLTRASGFRKYQNNSAQQQLFPCY